jgi:hypothetical protein
MKEVFIKIHEGCVKWFGPDTTGSEPFHGNKNEAIGRVINCLMDLSRARGEEWSFRFTKTRSF